jgi:hypothetical protein
VMIFDSAFIFICRLDERNHLPVYPDQCSGISREEYEYNQVCDAAIFPTPESCKSRKSSGLHPICHVTISCDYHERFISARFITKLIETTSES